MVDPRNAALVALRSLSLPRLRARFSDEILKMKLELEEADNRLRELTNSISLAWKRFM